MRGWDTMQDTHLAAPPIFVIQSHPHSTMWLQSCRNNLGRINTRTWWLVITSKQNQIHTAWPCRWQERDLREDAPPNLPPIHLEWWSFVMSSHPQIWLVQPCPTSSKSTAKTSHPSVYFPSYYIKTLYRHAMVRFGSNSPRYINNTCFSAATQFVITI